LIIVEQPDAGDNFELRLTLVPHRSMSWQDNKKVIALLGITCLGIAIVFTVVLDAWLILPFAGLEALAVAIGLYYASWRISYRDIITVARSTIRIDKGVYRPRKSWTFNRHTVRLEVSDSKHDWESKTVELHSDEAQVQVGKFLSKSDIEKLITLLMPLVVGVSR